MANAQTMRRIARLRLRKRTESAARAARGAVRPDLCSPPRARLGDRRAPASSSAAACKHAPESPLANDFPNMPGNGRGVAVNYVSERAGERVADVPGRVGDGRAVL